MCPGDPVIQIVQSAEEPTRKGSEWKSELTKLTQMKSSRGGNATEVFVLFLESQEENYQ